MVWIFIGIVMTGCILGTGYCFIRMGDYKCLYEHEVVKNEGLTKTIYYLKNGKEDSEWMNLTTMEIVKSIVEDMYKSGKLDVKALLMDGKVKEEKMNSLVIHYGRNPIGTQETF